MARRRPLTVLALLLATLFAPGPAAAQDRNASPFLFGRLWRVADSTEVQDQLESAREAVEAGEWDRAAAKLQHVLDYYPDHVVRIGDQSYVGARDWVVRLIADWPEAGREAYRRLVDSPARALLTRGLDARDVDVLRRVWLKYPYSTHAGTALNAEGLVHLSAGRFRRAVSAFEALLRGDVPSTTPVGDLRVRLGYALARLGRTDEIEALRAEHMKTSPESEVTLAGTRHRVADRLAKSLKEAASVRLEPPAWPHYGGSPAHDLRPTATAKPGRLQWSVGPPEGPEIVTRSRDSESGFYPRGRSGWPGQLERWYPVHPVVADGRVVVHDGRRVQAFDPFTGETIWRFDRDKPAKLHPPRAHKGRTNFATVYSATTTRDTVYVNLEVPTRVQPDGHSRMFGGVEIIVYMPEHRLFALDSRTGVLRWSHVDEDVEDWPEGEFLRAATVNSPPLAVGNRLFVPMTVFEGRYHAYLCAFDRHTGRLLWRTRICSGQMELNLFGRPVKEGAPSSVAHDGRHLYVCTNLGVAASLDPTTGLIRWVRGYPQIPIPHTRHWNQLVERDATWTNAPPIVIGDTVFMTPVDSQALIALNRDDGATRWRFRGSERRRGRRGGDQVYEMIGADDRHVYVAGTSVFAIDRRTGKLRWQGTFGDAGEEAAGRGLVTDSLVYCPTVEAIHAYDTKTGALRWRRRYSDLDGPTFEGQGGGNLVLGDGVLLVAGRMAVEAYYDWRSVFGQLKARIEREPHDPYLRLRAGRIFLRGERLAEAAESFERALRFAAKLPVEDAERVRRQSRRGVHEVRMVKIRRTVDGGQLAVAARMLEAALRTAPDAVSRKDLRRLGVQLADLRGDAEGAIRLLRAMETQDGGLEVDSGVRHLGSEALRDAARRNLLLGEVREAIRDLQGIIERYPDDLWSEGDARPRTIRWISDLIEKHGRKVYGEMDRKATRILERVAASGRESALFGLVRHYPNSLAAPRALVHLARLRLAAGDTRKARDFLRQRGRIEGQREENAEAMMLLALCEEKRERFIIAHGILRTLRDRYGDVPLPREGKGVHAREFVAEHLAREEYRRIAAASGLPSLPLPVTRIWTVDEGRDSMTRLLPLRGVLSAGIEGKTFVFSDGMLFGRDARTGMVLWRHSAPGISLDSHLAVCDGRLVLEGSDSVVALDPELGLAMWEYGPDRPVLETAANDETVFVLVGSFRPDAPRMLVALESRRGRILWQRDLVGNYREWLLLTPESVIVQSTRPPAIQVLDALTGELSFEIRAEGQFQREPFLLSASQLVTIRGSRDSHHVDLWDLPSKRKAWTYSFPRRRFFSSALGLGGQILLTDTSDTLHLVDGATGKEIWTSPVPNGRNLAREGESGDDDHVYIVHHDSEGRYTASALDRVDGSLRWATSLVESRAAHIRPIPTRDSVIYHINAFQLDHNRWQSRTLILDRATGEVRQEIVVEEVQGGFSEVVAGPGLLGFHGRGRVVMFGSEKLGR